MTRSIIPAGLLELRDVAPGVAYLRTLMANLFFIHDPERPAGPWLLIDAGLQGFANTIRRTAEARFGRGRPPAAIVLTHGHFDHVGSLISCFRRGTFPSTPTRSNCLIFPEPCRIRRPIQPSAAGYSR